MGKNHAAMDPDILSSLSADDRAKITKHSVKKDYPKEAVIYSPGDTARYVFHVLEGRVKIYDLSACGREIVFRTCGPKSFFGMAEIFGRSERQVYAEATEPVKILCIEKPAFELLIKSNPVVALMVIRVLGNRVRQAHRSIKSYVFSDARSRMAQLLINLAETDGERRRNGTVVLGTRLTHQTMADMIGAIRQTVSEIIIDLKKQGYIKTDRGIITILDHAGLAGLIHD